MEAVRGALARLRIDPYILAILATVVFASLVPARGEAADVVAMATKIGVALVFFLHGAKLSPQAVVAGIAHWRLHLVVLLTTFALFPVAGLLFSSLPSWIVPAAVAPGLIYLACLPSTIQSAVGFTAVARGNVAAAVCGASASNLLGVAITPLLVGLLLSAQGGGLSWGAFEAILLQLLVPFIAGQLMRRWIGGFIQRHAKQTSLVDRGSILLVVYNAFSGAVAVGIWSQVSMGDLIRLSLICLVLLAGSVGWTVWISRRLKFPVEDEATILFGGSNKSLAAGAPMAAVLFPAATVGFILLPIMLYHQFQLMACAAIAGHYAKRAEPPLEIS
ncbi:MAG: bile acid:sodium symporter [Phenylobacterium sp.]|nr:bile acid:sodium symporter family protein [Phenylobacterium sp.]MCG9916506.1 bile acid:sodium symporter [Phenylobacterium sp.]